MVVLASLVFTTALARWSLGSRSFTCAAVLAVAVD